VAANYAVGNVTHDISTLPVMVRELYSVQYSTEDDCPSVLASSAVERVSSKTRLLGEDGIGARWWRQDFGNVSGRPVTVLRGLDFDFDGVELVTSVPSPPFLVPPRPPHSPTSLNPNIGKSLLTETKSLLISASPSSMSDQVRSVQISSQVRSWMCSRVELSRES
jgi:hypothetical protein